MPESTLSGAQSVVRPAERAAAWRAKVEENLRRLQSLPSNWNSYGAKQVDPAILSAAADLLNWLSSLDLLAPALVPTVAGGIQIEWHDCGVDLEIELLSPQTYRLSFDDLAAGREENAEGSARTCPALNLS